MECKRDDNAIFRHDEKMWIGERSGNDRRPQVEWNVLNLLDALQQSNGHRRNLSEERVLSFRPRIKYGLLIYNNAIPPTRTWTMNLSLPMFETKTVGASVINPD